MNDLISRQNVIKAVCNAVCECDVPHYPDCDQIKYCDEIQALISLPSADKPTRWISVSERLPEKNGCYLVSTTGENNYIIDIAFYIEGMWHKTSRIKAWMPLPEPYKEEREEYELATEQMEHDTMYELTYNSEDGSM